MKRKRLSLNYRTNRSRLSILSNLLILTGHVAWTPVETFQRSFSNLSPKCLDLMRNKKVLESSWRLKSFKT